MVFLCYIFITYFKWGTLERGNGHIPEVANIHWSSTQELGVMVVKNVCLASATQLKKIWLLDHVFGGYFSKNLKKRGLHNFLSVGKCFRF